MFSKLKNQVKKEGKQAEKTKRKVWEEEIPIGETEKKERKTERL